MNRALSSVCGTLCLWRNPLFVKGVRARLRLKHAVVWGTISFAIAAFLFLLVYLSFTERRLTEPDVAAKATLIPLLVMQGVVLMLLGTGSVASGIALERDSGILDFHRMTPMPPGRKILGYLLGLPVREYFMFGTTLPFVVLAVWLGRLPLLKVAHLYGVFFCAVLLYHLTGFVAGMVAAKPRRASWIAQAAVLALYLLLPRLSALGFTFFSYFTILPAFRALVAKELPMSSHELRDLAALTGLSEEQTVPFFGGSFHPTTYSVLLQGFLALSLAVVVHRKWRQETYHAFPKPFALVFYAALQVLLVGSLWPFLTSARDLVGLSRGLRAVPELKIFLYVFLLLTAAASVFLLHLVTPTRATQLRGLRRARKESGGRVPVGSDAASSVWHAVAFVALAAASYAVLVHLARAPGGGLDRPPPPAAVAAPIVLLAAMVVSVQAAREAWSPRWFVLFVFLLWFVPFFVFLVGIAAWGMNPAAAYLSLPSPFTAFLFAVDALIRSASDVGGPPPAVDPAALTAAALALNLALAAGLTVLRIRGSRALRRLEESRPPAPADSAVRPFPRG
jgi:hypothetical protein